MPRKLTLFKMNLSTLVLSSVTMLFWLITTILIFTRVNAYGRVSYNPEYVITSNIIYAVFKIMNIFIYLSVIAMLISIFAITLQDAKKDETIAKTRAFAISNFALILIAQLVSWLPTGISIIGLFIQVPITVLLGISMVKLKPAKVKAQTQEIIKEEKVLQQPKIESALVSNIISNDKKETSNLKVIKSLNISALFFVTLYLVILIINLLIDTFLSSPYLYDVYVVKYWFNVLNYVFIITAFLISIFLFVKITIINKSELTKKLKSFFLLVVLMILFVLVLSPFNLNLLMNISAFSNWHRKSYPNWSINSFDVPKETPIYFTNLWIITLLVVVIILLSYTQNYLNKEYKKLYINSIINWI
ncbi:hypothetical protein ACXYRK_03890 [Mycoplasma sp. AC1221]